MRAPTRCQDPDFDEKTATPRPLAIAEDTDDTDAVPDEALATAAPLQPAPESEDVLFRNWECRHSPGCGPLVQAIARSWNRHWHSCHSAQQRVADAIAQRLDRTLERLYPLPL